MQCRKNEKEQQVMGKFCAGNNDKVSSITKVEVNSRSNLKTG